MSLKNNANSALTIPYLISPVSNITYSHIAALSAVYRVFLATMRPISHALLLLTLPACSLALRMGAKPPKLTLPKLPNTPARFGSDIAQPPHLAAAWALTLATVPLPALAEEVASTATEVSTFSSASYYTTLALYVLALPGVYSLVTRSVKAKVVRKVYEVLGPAADGGRPTRELAGDIVGFFQANNYKIQEASDVIIFEGVQAPVAGRAAFLTFCVFVALGSLALVLSIFEQGVFGEGNGLGNYWYLSTLVSPVAGKYYLDNAERTDQITVKIVTEDDEMSAEVLVQGNEEEVDRLQKALDLREKGMVYVKGVLE